jgi:O-acetyl-ADP-ribose deacetylase (regulator of RNase III)
MKLHIGSILDVPADAVVNPANSFLRHGGGLAAVIDRAATALLPPETCSTDNAAWNARIEAIRRYSEDSNKVGLIPTGGAAATSAGALSFKHIIHTVGPIWGGGSYCEADLLELAMENACETAIKVGAKSLAVPAISCGIFGYPVAEAARILVSVAQWYGEYADVGIGLDIGLDITFAVMGDEHTAAFRGHIPE